MISKPARGSQELAEAVGRLLIIGFEGTEFSELKELVTSVRPAGLIFFKRNYPAETGGPRALRHLIEQAQNLAESHLGRRLLVAIDHEGGSVQRLPRPYTKLPPAQDMARVSADEITALYERAGRELAATGFNVNFAPVLDLAPPDSPVMGSRAFSDEPFAVARYGQQVAEAYGAAGVMTCGKHFPGLGSAVIDPHHELPIITLPLERLIATETAPFRALAASLPAIMTTHALYPALDRANPATFSPRIADMVKKDLNFGGVLVTDDLEMGAVVKNYPMGEAAVAAVAAGHDLALVCRRADYIQECANALATALSTGRISEARLADAHERGGRFCEKAHQARPEQSRLDECFEYLATEDIS